MRARLGYVAEADLDLILVLDAWSQGPLTAHLARRAEVRLGSDVTACRSTLRCAGTRETDVEISWDGGALLVEDKIDAEFTPGQPLSYATEVKERRAAGEDVRAVLVCPARRRPYLELEAAGAFDAIVTCEELAEVAEAAGGAGVGSAMVLRAAAEAKPTRPVTAVDLVRSEWGDGYRRVVAELVPAGVQLSPGEGSLRTATAEWMWFRSAGVDPKGVWGLGHWIPGGMVRIDLMVLDEPSNIPGIATLVRKPTMYLLEVGVPALTFERPAGEQRDEVAEAVRALLELRRWAGAARLRPRPDPGVQRSGDA